MGKTSVPRAESPCSTEVQATMKYSLIIASVCSNAHMPNQPKVEANCVQKSMDAYIKK